MVSDWSLQPEWEFRFVSPRQGRQYRPVNAWCADVCVDMCMDMRSRHASRQVAMHRRWIGGELALGGEGYVAPKWMNKTGSAVGG